MTSWTIHGKRVVVGGLGRSGLAACRLALRQGAARVIALDQRPPVDAPSGLDAVFRDAPEGLFATTDLFVVSPGIPLTHEWVVAARDAGVPIIGEMALAASYLDCPVLAVTGTNGKSTVTTLAAQVAQSSGLRVFEGGNLGIPLSEAVLEGVPWDAVVVEVSSYQMEWPGEFKPTAAVVLNLTPDHLARHGTMESYADTKLRIFARMDDGACVMLPAQDELLLSRYRGLVAMSWLGGSPGVNLDGDDAVISWPRRAEVRVSLKALALEGEHNRWNMAVALWLAGAIGVSVGDLTASVSRVKGLAHRMESLGEHEGVLWINDSKATNVEAAEVAIRGVNRACIILLGGQAKGPGYGRLREHLGRHRAVVAFGGSRELVSAELDGCGIPIVSVESMEDAVQQARRLSMPGDGVLLTPGGSSFDAFRNFEHRGEVFRRLVEGA